MGGDPVEMSRPRNTERFDALHSLLSFGMITACVEERGGFYCFLTDFSSSFTKLSVPAVVGDALVAAGVVLGITSDCGRAGDGAGCDEGRALEGCAAGGVRAVDLQWTGLEKLQGKQGLLTRRDLWTRTEAPVTALLGRSEPKWAPMCGCRPIMTNRGLMGSNLRTLRRAQLSAPCNC